MVYETLTSQKLLDNAISLGLLGRCAINGQLRYSVKLTALQEYLDRFGEDIYTKLTLAILKEGLKTWTSKSGDRRPSKPSKNKFYDKSLRKPWPF